MPPAQPALPTLDSTVSDPPPIPPPLTDAARGIRLQKAMAEAGVASRRRCEQLIEQGVVTVNGQPVTALPAWVDPMHDRIEVEGQPVARRRRADAPAHAAQYLMVNKPKRVITTNDDPQGRRRVIDLVADAAAAEKARLFPVGRLDADSTGLILLTNDGELAHRLTHPRYGVAKRYRVTVRGRLEQADLRRLRDGLHLADRRPGSKPGAKKASAESVRVLKHERDREHGDRTILAMTLTEGQNREIRRMLARLGFKVRRLHRVGFGPVKLDKLPHGGWRPLTKGEVRKLRAAAGLDEG